MRTAQQYVFIVTYGRSGSTIVQKILNSIDGYKIRGENGNALYSLFLAKRGAQFARKEWGAKGHSVNCPWYGADLIDPKSFADELVETFINKILNPSPTDRVLGFKEIRYFQNPHFRDYLMFIREHLAPAKFILLQRSHDEVANSAWWKDIDPDEVKADLTKADFMMKAFAEKFPEESYILSYNDFVADPTKLQGLYSFLGERFDLDRIKAVLSEKLSH